MSHNVDFYFEEVLLFPIFLIFYLSLQLMNYKVFDKEKVFAISTSREGGVSIGNYASLNLCDYTDDKEECVKSNRQIFCNKYDVHTLVMPHQTHTSCVKLIDDVFLNMAPREQKNDLEGVDGLITSLKGVCIGVNTADCVPLLMYDDEHGVVAAVHAGWRGTLAGIGTVALEMMHEHYDTCISNIKVAIGPCISKESYVVGEDLMEQFDMVGFDVNMLFHYNGEELFLDLKEANRLQLLEMGVEEGNIEVSDVCTFKDVEHYFSARRLGVKSGRVASCIMLR